MTDGKFMKAIGFTLVLTLALIVGEIVLGIIIARALNAKIKGKTFFRGRAYPQRRNDCQCGQIYQSDLR